MGHSRGVHQERKNDMSFEGLNKIKWRETTATIRVRSSKKYITTDDDDDIICNYRESDWVCCMNEKHECMFSRKGKYLTVVGDKLVMKKKEGSFKTKEDFLSLVFRRHVDTRTQEEHLIHSKPGGVKCYVSTSDEDHTSGVCRLCLHPNPRDDNIIW